MEQITGEAPRTLESDGGKMTDTTQFLEAIFGETTEPCIEIRSFSNEPGKGQPATLFTSNLRQIQAFIERNNVPGRGVFFGVCTRTMGSKKGSREFVQECTVLWADIDCLEHGINQNKAYQVLVTLPYQPPLS